MINNREISGSIVGQMYIPDAYQHIQFEPLRQFYFQNKYLEVSRITSIGIKDHQKYFQHRFEHDENFPELLDDVYVDPIIIFDPEIVENMISVLQKKEILHVFDAHSKFFPDFVSVKGRIEALGKIVRRFEKFQELKIMEFCGFVILPCLLENIAQSFDDHLLKLVNEWKEKSLATNQEVLPSMEPNDDSNKKNGRKVNKEKKKKIAKAKSHRSSFFLDRSDVESFVRKNPLFGISKEIVSTLSSFILPQAQKKAIEYSACLFKPSAVGLRKKHGFLIDKLVKIFDHIQIFCHAIAVISTDFERSAFLNLSDSLNKHLLSTLYVSFFDVVFLIQALDHDVINNPSGSSATIDELNIKLSKGLSQAERDEIMDKIPNDTKLKLQNYLNCPSAVELTGLLLDLPNGLGLTLKKIDRKIERTFIHQMRTDLIQQVQLISTNHILIQLVAVILFSQSFNAMPHLPSRALPHLIDVLQEKILPEPYKLLRELFAKVFSTPMSELSEDEISMLRSLVINPSAALLR